MKRAEEWMRVGEEMHRNCRFGEAVNAFRSAASCEDATEEIKAKARVSIELIQEINGFVNKDLMNP